MCRSSDPYCFAATVSFDSLDDGLPAKPVPITVVDRLPGRTFPPPPADLSRVLFFPKHNSKVTHLPVYEITDAYRQAVKEAALGSNMYKINMMFMSRPKGDGTDAEVCFFVDVASDKSRVTIEERSMTTGEGATATITLPTEQYGYSSLTVSGLGVFDIHASANRSSRTDETGRPLGTDFRQYPAMTMKSDAHPGTQWQVRSEDPGSLCYYLMESNRDQTSHKESLRVHAIYHYAGGHPHHPVDHSEGVLLLPAYQDSRNEIVSIALVFLLLWHMRELDVQQEKASLFKILGKLGIKKTNP